MMHSEHIATYYAYLLLRGADRTEREWRQIRELRYAYNEAARDEKFAAKFFRY